MPLSATVSVGIDFNQSGSADFGPQRFEGKVSTLLQFANGTGANQADILFADERTVASNTNDDLDLAGVLSNAFGQTITAAKVVAVLLINKPLLASDPANTTNLTLGGSSNPVPSLSSGAIGPGGAVLLVDPDAGGLATVTASTGDILRVANSSGAAAKYQILILARSA
jgi:hypothetical protein